MYSKNESPVCEIMKKGKNSAGFADTPQTTQVKATVRKCFGKGIQLHHRYVYTGK